MGERAEHRVKHQSSVEESVTPSSPAKDPGVDKRRSKRLVLALPIRVKGVDALNEPFTELTRTVMVSCHGCKYQSRHFTPKGTIVTLEIPRGNPAHPPRTIEGKVIWIQRPRHARELLHIGLNFEVPGNVWDIPMPPDDWFPLPGEPAFVMEEPVAPPAPLAAPAPAAPVTLTASWDASEILLMASRVEGHEAELAKALQTAKSATAPLPAPAVSELKSFIPKKTDPHDIHQVVEQAVKASLERFSESAVQKIVHQVKESTAALLEETRRAQKEIADELDARIHQAVLHAWQSGRHGGRRSRNKR